MSQGDGQAGFPSLNATKPYWLKEPSPILLSHRTTPELPATADVVVVGSGITGAFASYFLKNSWAKDERVVMLEAREACSGATGRNGGHCQPQVYASVPAVAEFELQTFRFLRDLVKDNAIPCDWVSLTGVHAFLTQDIFDLAVMAVEDLEKHHPSLAEQVEVVFPSPGAVLSPAQKENLAALRVPSVKGAIVQKSAASLWPYKLVTWVLEGLLESFAGKGFNLQTNTPVTALHKMESGSEYPWLLKTHRGSIAAKKVLLATNGYTSNLLPEFRDLIVPVRGQVSALLPPSPPGKTMGQKRSISEDPVKLQHSYGIVANNPTGGSRDDYLVQRPLPGGELIFGGGRSQARGLAIGEWRDDKIEESVARFLRGNLSPPLDLQPQTEEEWLPGLDDEEAGESGNAVEREELSASFEWTGVMGFSRDHHAWVGHVPENLGGGGRDGGLYICAGYSGHGMPTAALSARAVVEQMGGAVEGFGVTLPKELVLSGDRVRRTREEVDTIQQQGEKGWAAVFPELLERV
ncbi:FAD dependent oxidoreductase [Cercophora scortea]|uniref:FAD dependent oxidoreductase n=1 Tax=Cercophora scortea TaxID=314031 RepID=A0AAE0MD23_9PEZI|nr:FAD dependent oxidoreductase [Cercophora scortea]